MFMIEDECLRTVLMFDVFSLDAIPTPNKCGIKMAFPVYFWYLTPKNKVFGEKVHIHLLPLEYCVHTTHDGNTQTQLFQFHARVKM